MLGTASQAAPHRAHLSPLRVDDLGLLLDRGEGAQRPLLHAGVPARRLGRIREHDDGVVAEDPDVGPVPARP